MRQRPSDLYADAPTLIDEAVGSFGIHATVDSALALLEGVSDYDKLVVPLEFLGGASAARHLERGDLAHRKQDHWPRVWAARTLLHVWLSYASMPVLEGFEDDHWRVREMCIKVAVARELPGIGELIIARLGDVEPRVQIAALRAAPSCGDDRHRQIAADLAAINDPREVRVAAVAAVRALKSRPAADGKATLRVDRA